MMRKSKMLILAGAFAALGVFGAEAKATFLVQVTATLKSPGGSNSGMVVVGQSATNLSVFTSAPADVDLGTLASPVHETYGQTKIESSNTSGTGSSGNSNTTGSDSFDFGYRWTLTFAHVVNGKVMGPTASLDVSGTILGNLSAFGSTLNNTYNTISTLPLLVDSRPITVTLDPWTPPGTPPTSIINFGVGMSYTTDGAFHPVPEPSTIALLGIGGLLLASPRLRRRPQA
jgi:hypothetical protein